MADNIRISDEELDREEMLLAVHRAMRRSNYVLSSGQASREYVDFDGYILGGQGDYDYDAERSQNHLKQIAEKVVPAIVAAARKYAVGRIAFPEKPDDGPVGMLSMRYFTCRG